MRITLLCSRERNFRTVSGIPDFYAGSLHLRHYLEEMST